MDDGNLSCTHLQNHVAWARLYLAEVTERICPALGVRVNVLPTSNEPVRTTILTNKGLMHS